jgi:hypothetical protein
MRQFWIPALLLSACIESDLKNQDDDVDQDSAAPDLTDDTGAVADDTGGPPDPPEPPVEVSLSAPSGVVLDPKLSGAPALDLKVVQDGTGCTVSVTLDNGIGQSQDLPGSSVSWDGRDADGLWFEPGPARAQAMIDCGDGPQARAALELHIVRLGLLSIDLHSPDGEDGEVPLAFHKSGLITGEISPIGDRAEIQLSAGLTAAAGSVDDDLGQPRDVPRWTNPDSAPWALTEPIAHNVPAGFVAGSAIAATVVLGEQAVSESRHIAVSAFGPRTDTLPDLRLSGSETVLSPGGEVTLLLDPASATMGREVRTITWTFEATDEAGEVHLVPGHIETSMTVYTLAGPPALLDGTDVGAAPPIPWIGVLDDTAEAMTGVDPTPAAVLDVLRDHLFEHDYIIYDPGDSAYTSFTGAYMYWTSITADLSGFLDRSGGLNLYCHSMSCLLSALAGNHGVEAPQIVLGTYFNTNQTRAAGGDEWRRWSFNSHSVVTPDGGATIWDSSIALDGDDDPYSEPIEEVMPRGMEREEYFWRLTYDDIEIINSGLCYIR